MLVSVDHIAPAFRSGCLIFFSVVFKYFFTGWVDKKIETKIKWAATTRVAQEAGFRGVLVIRYSIIPPRESSVLAAVKQY